MKNIGIREGFSGEMVFRLNRDQIGQALNDTLFCDLYVTDIGYFPHASNHFVDRLQNPLDECVLIYCIGGEGWYKCGGERAAVENGQYILIPSGEAHCYGSSAGWQIYWIHFGGNQSAAFCKRLLKAGCLMGPGPRAEEAVALFEKMIRRAEEGLTVGNAEFLHFAAWHLLGLFALPRSLAESTETSVMRIDASIHFMKEHVSGTLTLDEMVSHAGYSKSHFIHLFKERTGYAPMDFFIQLKVQYAGKLLTTTDLKVFEVAHQCGYEDPYYFSRLFKKISGFSPKYYRQQFRL